MTLLTVPGQGAAMGIAEAGITAVLGYGVVFLGLILLMLVVTLMGMLFSAKSAKKAAAQAAEEEIPQAVAVETDAPLAPGSAGQLKLHNVEPKTAAMLMAIVADKLGKPLNELRFISIKEVE